MDTDEQGQAGPQPERPAVLDTRPNGLEVTSVMYSINDKALGAGEPIRVKQGDRVLMHLLNASAIENRRDCAAGASISGARARWQSGADAASGRRRCSLAPASASTHIVEMNQPGVWILGATDGRHSQRRPGRRDRVREPAQRAAVDGAEKSCCGTTRFSADAGSQPAPDQTIDMVFEKVPSGAGKFNLLHVNGKPYPHEKEFVLKQGARYRLVFHNRTDDAHPLHMHRHLFELVDINGKPTAGIMKDTVIVPFYGRATVDLIADQPGLTLFHCHIQQHMDYGFKALFSYE